MTLHESQTDAHMAYLATSLHAVPEVRPAIELIGSAPDFAGNVYERYQRLIGRMALLDVDEIGRIDLSQQFMADASGASQGSASKIGANDILRALGENTSLLSELAMQSVNPKSPYYQPAINELVSRMEGGHQMSAEGISPSDDDPRSHEVIWGHTVITDEEALLNFIICHYLERFFAEALADKGYDFARQKDFLINALDDVVILEHLDRRGMDYIYNLWSKPKKQGGLEWITSSRIKSYGSVAE